MTGKATARSVMRVAITDTNPANVLKTKTNRKHLRDIPCKMTVSNYILSVFEDGNYHGIGTPDCETREDKPQDGEFVEKLADQTECGVEVR